MTRQTADAVVGVMTHERLELENDAVPVVRIIAARITRALRHEDYRKRLEGFRSCIALASTADPQALTIRRKQNAIRLERGVARDAAIVIRLDFERIGEAGYSPKVEGLLRHPLVAWQASRLLNFPVDTWADAAKRFWEQTAHFERMPASIRITCSDDDREIILGDHEHEPEVEIEGDGHALGKLFTGSSILVQSVIKRQIKIVSSFEHIAVLSGVTLQLMLGEIDCE